MMRCGVGPIRANVWKNQPELGIIAVSDAHCLITGRGYRMYDKNKNTSDGC